MTQATQSLQKIPTGQNSLAGVDMGELQTLAEWAVKSGMFQDVKSVSQGGMKILAGRELNIQPVDALRSIHFINGKPVLSSEVMAALIKNSRKYNYRVLEHDEHKCVIEFWEFFNGQWQKMGVPVSYTDEDAKRENAAGKQTYKLFSEDMYFAACIRKGVRRYCPDILRGASFAAVPESEAVVADMRSVEADYAEELAPEEDAPTFDAPLDYVEGEFTETDVDMIRDDAGELETMRVIAREKLADLTPEQRKRILKGRDVEMMELEPLKAMIENDLAAF